MSSMPSYIDLKLRSYINCIFCTSLSTHVVVQPTQGSETDEAYSTRCGLSNRYVC